MTFIVPFGGSWPVTTRRLYFDDARRLRFDALVVAVDAGERGVCKLVLDQTAFYPEGGGQPADQGRLHDLAVVDVQEDGDVIFHHVQGVPPAVGQRVWGEVDGPRRLDHMQQHTGQHLLSSLLLEKHGLETLAFHMGRAASTIDVPGDPLPATALAALEDDLAQVVREARPVTTRIHQSPAELPAPLRKPPAVAGPFRVVTIDGLDRSPCGGTHVANTAELELLSLASMERLKRGVSRIEFRCGGRARHDLRARITSMRALRRVLQAEEAGLQEAVERQSARIREQERNLRALTREVLPVRVDALLAGAERVAGHVVLVREVGAEVRDDLAALGRECGSRPTTIAVLLCAGQPRGQIVCGACPPLDARAVVLAAGGSGGGSAGFAQGSFVGEAAVALSLADRFIRGRLAEASGGDG